MKDKLAIIVPYRDRQDHLDVFVPHMHEFLKDKGIDYTIFIAEQTDERPFNYGKLCNVVSKEVGKEYTYFAFHDIDMLPMNDECDYGYPDSPTHLATNVEAHDNKLPYPQYFGGVVLISREDFENANGYSNEYWGYGFEDLDLLYRLQRSGAYLEKKYDLNNVYSNYDELDVLPYRIENVNVCNEKRIQQIEYNTFSETDYIYGLLNPLTKKMIKDSFSISFWFNDDFERKMKKNLFVFEGCDSGLFLSRGNEIIAQIWDNKNNHEEIILSYSRNRWNHCVYSYDSKENILKLSINDKTKEIKLKDNFEIYDYSKNNIKISDDSTSIMISNILAFDSYLSDEVINILYNRGNLSLDDIHNKFGLSPVINLKYNSLYKQSILLDSGSYKNHLKFYGSLQSDKLGYTPNELYLPIRLDSEYKSLVHENDTDIIKRYYKYDPDITENSDIFFHDVIPNKLDYKSIGLSTLNYSILDIQNKKNYELIRIVT
jgi:hypothetical protein